MQMNITGHHVDVSPALREYVTEKIQRIGRHFDRVLSVNVILNVEKLQQQAEATVNDTVLDEPSRTSLDADGNEIRHVLQMSITAVEPPTGFVRAMVGGRNYELTQANLATGAGSTGRQPGSSFKPFVLATAFEQGLTPDTIYSGSPLTIGDYEPQNYGGAVYGDMTLREATERSVNTAFVRLMQDVDPYEAVDLARELGTGITEIDPTRDGSGLAIALGAKETTTLGMASAYGVFANRGQRLEPTPIVRVFGADGELLVDNSVREAEQVIQQVTADNVTDVLRGVITNGTASGRGIGRPAAGKTGTTDDNNDGWFVGYTPTLSTAVFIGWDRKIAPDSGLSRAVRGVNLTGGSFPAQAWQRFMSAALQGVPATDFSEPAPIEEPVSVEIQRERRGFGPGAPSAIIQTGPGGPYLDEGEPPAAPSATSSTTTTSTTTTTTTTTTTIPPPPTTDDGNCGLFGCD